MATRRGIFVDKVGEYLDQKKQDLTLKLMQSSVSMVINTTYEVYGISDQPEITETVGAGVVTRHPSGENYVLTCAHLFKENHVKSINDIKMTDFHGNSLRPIKVISCDEYDVAIIKISNTGDAVPIEQNGEFGLRDEVLGFGRPYGYDSVYSGIVSSDTKKYLVQKISGPLEENDKGIDKLEKYMLSNNTHIPAMITFFRNLQNLRSTTVAHRRSESNKHKKEAEKYFQIGTKSYKEILQDIFVKAIYTINSLAKIENIILIE